MRLESRVQSPRLDKPRHAIILVAETAEESEILDQAFGCAVGEDGLIALVEGKVKLADGFREHYIELVPKS